MHIQDIQLDDLGLWSGPAEARDALFRELRDDPELHWFNEMSAAGVPKPNGFWAITRYEDVLEVSRRPGDFCSGEGVGIGDTPVQVREFFNSMIAMDDPRHARFRRIVSRGFTPRMLDSLKADVERIAAEIVGEVADTGGEFDFVAEVAARVPLRVIVDLMGIPRSEERFIFECSNIVLGVTDTEYVTDQSGRGRGMALEKAGRDLAGIVEELAVNRLRSPRPDLVSILVQADVDGERLTPAEVAAFFLLLVVAGNETTRNAIAHGLDLLTRHPDQRALWLSDFERHAPTAVEEIVRYASPVIHFRRTVTRDGVTLGDHTFREGEKVVLWYNAANRDERQFPEPDRFDITRTPNDHVGFGGPGPHFCLGAHLARREMTVTFRELFRQVPRIEAAGEPDRLRSNFINGIKHLPARV